MQALPFTCGGEPKFTFIILISIFFDYYLGDLIYCNIDNALMKKLYLSAAISLNLGLLVYFKYANFFVENVNALLLDFHVHDIKWIAIALPIGISFIVFEKITYLVDIYNSIGKPARSLRSYALYILLFPKLLAGPIVKYHDIENQLENRKHTLNDVIYGITRFSIGLAKKVLIADTLSVFVDSIFKMPGRSIEFF